jgi:hypothetical protein
MLDRRITIRKPLDVFLNKFIQGYPYLCRTVDVSTTGVLVETYSEPEVGEDRFPLELRLPNEDEALWLWVHRVRSSGKYQALEFVSASPPVRRRIEEFVIAANAPVLD